MFSLKRVIILVAACAILLASISALAGEKSGYLGVMLQDIDTSMAKALQLDEDGGVLINEIIDDSPADKAGLQEGDVFLVFNGKTIDSHKALTKAVRKTSPGDKIMVKVLRNGKTKNLDIVVGEREKSETMVWFDSDDDNFSFNFDEDIHVVMDDFDFEFNLDRGFLGVHLDDLNEQLGEYFEVEDGKGALVTKVTEDSSAEKAGLKAGDVIVSIGGTGIDSADDLHDAMADTKPEEKVTVGVMRKGKSREFDVTLGEMSDSGLDQIKMFTGQNNFSVHAPKMLMKHIQHPKTPNVPNQVHRMQIIEELKSGDLEDVRNELEELRNELKELRKSIKKD